MAGACWPSRTVSRRGVDHTARFADIAVAVAKFPARTPILDGEVCVFDAQLVSQFHLLGDSSTGELATPPVLIAFDLLRSGAQFTAEVHYNELMQGRLRDPVILRGCSGLAIH